jgi:hypothetical protein
MSSSDVLLIILVIAVIAFVVYRKRKKHLPLFPGASNTSSVSASYDDNLPLNFLALKQSQGNGLHGFSIHCFKTADFFHGDLPFIEGLLDNIPVLSPEDLELQINDEIKALNKDGFKPSISSIVNNNVVIFYITY